MNNNKNNIPLDHDQSDPSLSALHPTTNTASNLNLKETLFEKLSEHVLKSGYELVHFEADLSQQKTLRLFIDFLQESTKSGIGLEDCVKVTRDLEGPLDLLPEIDQLFKGPYELEVSSPGLERPLHKLSDYERFKEKKAKIHLFRPLTVEEIQNTVYCQYNPKQKNFIGRLKGVSEQGKIILEPLNEDASQGSAKKNHKKGAKQKLSDKSQAPRTDTQILDEKSLIWIPFSLIAKAHLDLSQELEAQIKDKTTKAIELD